MLEMRLRRGSSLSTGMALSTARPGRPRRWSAKRRGAMVAFTLTFIIFAAATARLFVFPRTDPPRQVDAIVMYDGQPNRRERALELARAGYAPVLVMATPGRQNCPRAAVPDTVRLICFRPKPSTTQGEARETARLAELYGWDDILLVVGRQQDTRARIRLGRCYDGRMLVDTVNPSVLNWPYAIAYEWGALVKALAVQQSC